jgi:uncharacterized protein (TIGR03083 family)
VTSVAAPDPGPLVASYAALTAVVAGLGDADAWTPTGCTGWTVRDLVLHLRHDAVRALVAAHTPAEGAADCDRIRYWAAWGSDPVADELVRRATRVEAGLAGWPELQARYVEAARAAVRAVAAAGPEAVVTTQGHAITVADLASTLAVEATLHHLDLVASLDAPGPGPGGLAEVRRVVEALLGPGPSLAAWSDERVALVGTGRAAPTASERADLGARTVPVFT